MWEYEHVVDAAVTPQAVWELWADVAGWQRWNADIEHVEIDGPFAVGSTITMTPEGHQPVRLRIVEAVPNERFVDEAEVAGVVVRTWHCLQAGDELGGLRVTYRTQISGPDADVLGSRLGPAITADFPQTMAALVALAAE